MSVRELVREHVIKTLIRGTLSALLILSSASVFADELLGGFSKVTITPQGFDSWIDKNGNAVKDSDESYVDLNKNGEFDPIYLAGFHQNRPAVGVHDDIYAVASVFRKNDKTIAFLTLDVIGFMIDDIEDIRSQLPTSLGIDHLVVHSLHNHESPDTQGLWGKNLTNSGVNKTYMTFLKQRSIEALTNAVTSMTPISIHYASIEGQDDKFGVVDTRVPSVLERGIKTVIFKDVESNKVKGTWLHFANHVETVWSNNLLITADWPGTTRKALESGIPGVADGIGGTASIFIGNIGGLATTLPDTPVYDPRTREKVTGASFEKVHAQGYALAEAVLKTWKEGKFQTSSHKSLFLKKRQFMLRVQNKVFIAAALAKIINRNLKKGLQFTTKTEMNHIGIGPLEILTIPGELYPEIAIGGVVNLPGSDFDTPPEEVPPLYSFMKGNLNMIFNLTNDSIGYIIPYTEWDEKSPYLNNDTESTYGESNSVGKNSGRDIYKAAREILSEPKSLKRKSTKRQSIK